MIKKIGNYLFYAIILFFSYYFVLQIFIPEKSIDYIGFRSFVVLTPSMEPKINVNDMVIVTKTKEDNINVGDIITFKVYISDLGEDAYVTHFVGDIQQNGDERIYYTQGINAAEGDYDDWVDEENEEILITYDDIAGKYLFKIPNLGFASRLLQDPFMVAFIVVDVIIIYALFKMIKKKD